MKNSFERMKGRLLAAVLVFLVLLAAAVPGGVQARAEDAKAHKAAFDGRAVAFGGKRAAFAGGRRTEFRFNDREKDFSVGENSSASQSHFPEEETPVYHLEPEGEGAFLWTSDTMPETGEEALFEPAAFCRDPQGRRYQLQSFRMEAAQIGERVQEVRGEVSYPQKEGLEKLPDTAQLTVRDEVTGRTVTEAFPVLHVEKGRQEWKKNFSFPVTFHEYDADEYQLGNRLLPHDEERPAFEECDEELLAMIGALPEDYQVAGGIWDGEPYYDENGVLCRDAIVSGSKKVTDYVVTYGGVFTFQPEPGWICKAVYTPAAQGWSEDGPSEAAVEMPREARSGQRPYWKIVRRILVCTISVGILLIAAAGGLWLAHRLAERRKEKKRRSI